MDNTVASKTIPLQIRKCVIRDIEKGESHRKIGEKYGYSKAAVTKLFAKYKTYGSVADRPGRGRKRRTDSRTDARII